MPCSIFLSIYILVYVAVSGQKCVITNNANGLPLFREYGFSNLNSDIIGHQHQAIIPSYRFSCCGNISEWAVDVQPGGQGDELQYTLNLQVWRPSPTVQTTGCYSMVGANLFTSVSLISRVVLVTPFPQEQIQFQPGDVLGFYVESALGDGRGVVVLNDLNTQGDRGYETEEVWHANIARAALSVQDCLAPVGSPVPGRQRILTESTNAAPVISVSYRATSCPGPVVTTPLSSLLYPESGIKATDHESSYPTTTIQDTGPLPTNSLNSGVIIGVAAGGILVGIIITLAVVIAIHLLKKKLLTEEFHPVSNEAYGIRLQDTVKQVESDTFYDYPTVDHEAIATEQNQAYATNIETEPSVAYAMNIATEKNKAYEAVSPSV